MADFSAKDVMDLKTRTGAGMMEVKKALTEANGSQDRAVELLREWGQAKGAAPKSSEMKEGLVAAKISDDAKKGVIIRLGCQTDFVARNEIFQKLLADLTNLAFSSNATSGAELHALPYPDNSGRTVDQVVKELIGSTVKENMAVTGFAKFEAPNGRVGAYVHHNAKVGTLVQVDGANNDAVKTLISEIAMHVTAGVPVVAAAVNREGVPKELVDQERAAAGEGLTGKPANIIEKIIAGKLDKFFADQALIEQPFIKDDKKRIRDLVAETAKATGSTLNVIRFARLKVGEA